MICSAHFLIKPRIRLGAPAFAPMQGGEGVRKEARDANEGVGSAVRTRGDATGGGPRRRQCDASEGMDEVAARRGGARVL